MTLTVYFYDAKGCSRMSPAYIKGEDPVTVYAEAVRMRTIIAEGIGEPIYLHTVEEP